MCTLGPEVIKSFFVLNLAKHENVSADKYEIPQYLAFSYSSAEKFSCSVMLSKKEFAIVCNLRFISRTV